MFQIIAVIAAVLALAVAVLVLILAAAKPATFAVERAATIHAPPERIFPLINDLHLWPSWSPYEVKDPAMQRSFSGASSGKGAIYEWKGNKNVGSGRMEIVETSSPSNIVIKLDFFTPFEGHNIAEFKIVSDGGASTVVWAMRGPAPFLSKLMQVFINLDTMIGKDFAIGLQNLKAIAERNSSASPA